MAKQHTLQVVARGDGVALRCPECKMETEPEPSLTARDIEAEENDHEGELAAREWTGVHVRISPQAGRSLANRTGTVEGIWDGSGPLMKVVWDEPPRKAPYWPIHHGFLLRAED
jgi:hypothetical protein